jgi:peptidoglycan/xylan/chitin deacetylase (PgdA/CDA1 family)
VTGSLATTGLLWRQVDRRLRGKVLVLTYHRVLPDEDRDSFSAPGIIVTPETFDRHLGWIRSYLHPLTPEEFCTVLNGERVSPRRACLVTFDDGWHDNLTHALPALTRHDVPALLFAATGFIGTSRCFWQERLSRLLYFAWRAGSRGGGLLELASAPTTPSVPDSVARRTIRDAVTRLKTLSQWEIDSKLQHIEQGLTKLGVALPTNFGDDRFLSWTDLKQLVASRCVTVGSHGVSHVPLPRLPVDLAQTELSQSRAVLKTQLSREIDWFAYPNGDYDAESMTLVRAAGFRGAFTTANGPVSPGQDAFSLRRVNMHEGSTRTLGRFLSRISGVL